MDTFTPLLPPNSAMQRIAAAQDALVEAGAGIPGPAFIAAFHGAKYEEALADLMPERAANLIYTLTGAGDHTRTLLAYALRGLGYKLVTVDEEPEVMPARSSASLSPRERDMLVCLGEGLTNKRIAARLGTSEATVKVHMKSLFRKLGVKNRTQAALRAAKVGA